MLTHSRTISLTPCTVAPTLWCGDREGIYDTKSLLLIVSISLIRSPQHHIHTDVQEGPLLRLPRLLLPHLLCHVAMIRVVAAGNIHVHMIQRRCRRRSSRSVVLIPLTTSRSCTSGGGVLLGGASRGGEEGDQARYKKRRSPGSPAALATPRGDARRGSIFARRCRPVVLRLPMPALLLSVVHLAPAQQLPHGRGLRPGPCLGLLLMVVQQPLSSSPRDAESSSPCTPRLLPSVFSLLVPQCLALQEIRPQMGAGRRPASRLSAPCASVAEKKGEERPIRRAASGDVEVLTAGLLYHLWSV